MTSKYKIVIAIVVVILALVAFSLFNPIKTSSTLGSTLAVQSRVATSSFQTATVNTARILFATSTSCSSRIISTQGTEIKLTFSDYSGQRPTGVNGHSQLASTTVAYDSELYGCDAVWVYPFGTNTLTLTETR